MKRRTSQPIRTRCHEIEPYITKDGSEIRECLHPDHHGPGRISMAEAVVPPGAATHMHVHSASEEIYRFLSGTGTMRLGKRRLDITPGDTVRIPAGTAHAIRNDGERDLVFLCCCSPPYRHEDTRLVGEDPFPDLDEAMHAEG